MGASTVAATLGQVGLPAPLAELAARQLGRDRGRRRPQRPDRRRLPGPGGPVGAGAGAARAARRRLHPGAALRRPRLPDQPLRLRGRPARPGGGRRAGAGAHGYRVFVGRPQPLVPVRRRHARSPSSSTATAPSPTCGPTGFAERDVAGRCSPTRRCSTGSGGCCGPGPTATPGRAPRRAASELEELLGHDEELISVRVRGVDRRDARPLRGPTSG